MRASLATFLAVGALSSGACVENDGAVFIEGVIPVTREEECTASSTSQVFQAGGTLDLAANTGYSAALKVRTNLPATFSGVDVAQGRTQSPNYPTYGNIDNNVLIIDSADVEFSFVTDPVTLQALVDTAADPDLAFKGELKCKANEGSCTYGARKSVASGSIFNPQTSLNTSQAIFTEAIPAELASELLRLYEAAADAEGVQPAGNTDDDISDEPNLLQVPALRQRVTAEISINGTTTGGARISSFPFPFPVELCVGCLAPDQSVCTDYAAVAFSVPDDLRVGCFVGVDAPTSVCSCVDEDNASTGVFINRDRTACAPAGP